MTITNTAVNRLIQATDLDLLKLLEEYNYFIQNQYADIVEFYDGTVEQANAEAFNNLAKLNKDFADLTDIIYLSREQLSNYEDWELVTYIEDIVTKLQSAANLSKWLRSSITDSSFSSNAQVEYVLTQQQTLENLAKNLNYENPQDGWADIALSNGLTEEDYSWEGGNILHISTQDAAQIFIQGVVDNLIGDKLYGSDLDTKTAFVNGDLKYLSNKETLFQSVKILVDLRKGDNPYYPNDGLQSNIAVGSNLRGMSVPSIIRQLTNTFRTDDTLQAIGITKVEVEDDGLRVEFNIKAKDKLIIPGTTLL